VITVRITQDGSFVDGTIHPFIQKYGRGPLPDTGGIVVKHMKSLTDTDVPASEASVGLDGRITLKK
jgi:hypothetical protein